MLTDTAIRAFKPKDKAYKRSDSGGLHLLVSPSGSKLWRLHYRFAGKQKALAGGSYPSVSLAEARVWRDEAKAILARGLDPSAQRKAEKRRQQISLQQTFETVAREWHAARTPKWSERYARIIMNRLEADLFPILGKMPISHIEPADVLFAIRKIEQRGAIDMARRVNNYVSEVFRYAVALGVAKRDPSRDILAALREKPPVQHRPSLRAKDLPEFFEKLERSSASETTKAAIWLTFYTLVRTQETVLATWDEFEDLDGAEPLWRIPAGRMKMRSPHIVPLAPQVVSLLRKVRAGHADPVFVFPGHQRETLNRESMRMAMNRMGYKGIFTPHGIRSTGSTILNESGLFQPDWIEMALAHQERNSVRAAYNAAVYLKQRRTMMKWWATYLDDQAAFGKLL